jgi:hypothetical protein
MRSCIPICPQNDLILVLEDLNGPAQITSLEPRLKDQSGIVLRGGDVKGQEVDSVGLGIDALTERGILLVVDYLVEQRVHEDDDLNVLFYRLLQDVLLGLENGVAFFVLRLDEIGVSR